MTKTVDGLLFVGGESRNCLIHVSINDLTLLKSSGMKHEASLYNIMMMETCESISDFTNQNINSMYIYVLIKCNGGCRHNLTHQSKKTAPVMLFLIGNINNLTYTCGWLWLFYFNMCERKI